MGYAGEAMNELHRTDVFTEESRVVERSDLYDKDSEGREYLKPIRAGTSHRTSYGLDDHHARYARARRRRFERSGASDAR